MSIAKRVARALPLSQALAKRRAAEVLVAAMKDRIFRQGQATQGALGNYRSQSHIQKRKRLGRQVLYKDLLLTGRLIRFLQARDGQVRWQSTEAAQIAEYQEGPRQVGKEIWTPRQEEIDAALEAYTKLLFSDVLRRIG